MKIDGTTMQKDGLWAVAREMCIAARTAPKTKGKDWITTFVLSGKEKEELAKKTEEIGWRDYGENAPSPLQLLLQQHIGWTTASCGQSEKRSANAIRRKRKYFGWESR